MGRQLRTDIPTPKNQLIPQWSYLQEFREKDSEYKAKQRRDYNDRHRVRPLDPLLPNAPVWIRTERSQTGHVQSPANTPRSNIVTTTDAELLQEDISAIQTWASTWQMNFNISKCCSIHFTQAITYKMEDTYYLYDTPLLSLDHFKYLGITLQSNLRYDRHVQYITAKANRTLGLLRRNVRISSPQLKEREYKALV